MSNTKQLLPMFVTDKLDAIKAFYVDGLGWELETDMDAYLCVRHGAAGGPLLAFVKPTAMMSEQPAFAGTGVIVSIPVQSADAHYDRARAAGLKPASVPSDKPWRWRSYLLPDPIGVILDFYHELAGE